MSCADAVEHARLLKLELMKESQSLEGAIFYPNTLYWNREDLPALLRFQRDTVSERGPIQSTMELARNWVQGRLEADVHEKILKQ